MRTCSILVGENVAPRVKSESEALIGKKVTYLRECDIDKSGRGYFWPRSGTVDGAIRREIIIDGDYIPLSSLREMAIL